MFGLPFFTSLIVTVALVVGFSFVINKGIAKKRASKQDGTTQPTVKTKKASGHA